MTIVVPILAVRDLTGAQPVSWSRLQQQWQLSSDGLLALTPVIVAMVACGVVLAVWWLWRSDVRRRLRAVPVQVFLDVVHGLGLSRAQQWLLIRAAQQQGLPSPLTLVLSEATFEHHTQAYTQSVRAGRRPQVVARLRRAHRVLFGA